jgi:hypothetical protein
MKLWVVRVREQVCGPGQRKSSKQEMLGENLGHNRIQLFSHWLMYCLSCMAVPLYGYIGTEIYTGLSAFEPI